MAGIRDDVGSEAADSPAFMCEENYGGNEQKTQRLEDERESPCDTQAWIAVFPQVLSLMLLTS